MRYSYVENGTVETSKHNEGKYPLATGNVDLAIWGSSSTDTGNDYVVDDYVDAYFTGGSYVIPEFYDEGVDLLMVDINALEIHIAGDWTNRRVIENGYKLALKRGNLSRVFDLAKVYPAYVGQPATRLILAPNVLPQDLFDFLGFYGSPDGLGKAFLCLYPSNTLPLNSLSTEMKIDKSFQTLSATFSWKNSASVSKNIVRWRAVPRAARKTDLQYQIIAGGEYKTFPTPIINSKWGTGETIKFRGQITYVEVIDPGEYDSTADVYADYPGGEGAIFSLDFSGEGIDYVDIVNPGFGYDSGFYLGTTGGGEIRPAILYAFVGVSAVEVLTKGYEYLDEPTLHLYGGEGSGADIMISTNISNEGSVDYVKVLEGGSGYSTGDSLVFENGGGTNAAGYVVCDNSGTVTSVVITEKGYGFSSIPDVLIDSAGEGCVLEANVSLYSPWNYVEVDPNNPTLTIHDFKQDIEYEWQLYSSTNSKQDLNNYSPSMKFKFY